MRSMKSKLIWKLHQIPLLFTLTKKKFNIVIMVFCVDCVDTKYKFTFVNIKDTGRQSDGSVYINNDMGYRFENDLLNVLQPTTKRYFHMFPLKMTPLVWKITLWNPHHTHFKICLLRREYLVTGHHNDVELLKMVLLLL